MAKAPNTGGGGKNNPGGWGTQLTTAEVNTLWGVTLDASSPDPDAYQWSVSGSTKTKSQATTVPGEAGLFSVTTPGGIASFTVTSSIDQLSEPVKVADGGDGDLDPDDQTLYSQFNGNTGSVDKLKISDVSGTLTDALFTNFSSVEVLDLLGSGGFNVTLATEAQGAGIEAVEGGAGNDSINASGYTSSLGIDIEGNDGNDTLTGGAGNDELDGGLGADVLDLTAGGVDVVEYNSTLDGSAVETAGESFDGFDVVTGFVTADDVVEVNFDFITAINGDSDVTSLTSYNDVSAEILSVLGAGQDGASGETYLFVISNGTQEGLYSAAVTDSNSDSMLQTFSLDNVTMLGQFNALSASDIV